MEKKLKKEYDKRRKAVFFQLNAEELSLIKKDMREMGLEGCSISMFIKYKVLGMPDSIRDKYRRMVETSTDVPEIKDTLLNRIAELDLQLDYVNLRFAKELNEISTTYQLAEDKKLQKKFLLLTSYKNAVLEKSELLFRDLQFILANLGETIKRKKKEEVQILPQSIIEEFNKNWHDTTSPEVIEGARRLFEDEEK